MKPDMIQKTKNTAVISGILLCIFAHQFEEDHDWNKLITEEPGRPARFTNQTRNVKRVPVTYGRRSKRPREIIQAPAGAPLLV